MLMIVNISEAKAQLSKLIDRVYHGEKIVIAKNTLPIADWVIQKPLLRQLNHGAAQVILSAWQDSH